MPDTSWLPEFLPLPSSQPPFPASVAPAAAPAAGRATIAPNFWSGNHPSLANSIQTGTTLTAVLDQDLSSAKSRLGDVFSLRLPDGYASGGMQIIPPGAKIIGAVTAVTPARNLRGGHAGQLQVALQSLLMPDGFTQIPLHGFIESNPNHVFKQPAQTRSLGSDVRDYGQQVAGMMGSFTSGLGTVMARRNRGRDFSLDKGEVVAVRLNRSLTVPEALVQPQTIPELRAVPQSLVAQPGMQAAPSQQQQQAVPGLSSAAGSMPPEAPPRAQSQSQFSTQASGRSVAAAIPPAVPGPATDVFLQPLALPPNTQNINDMPDPF